MAATAPTDFPPGDDTLNQTNTNRRYGEVSAVCSLLSALDLFLNERLFFIFKFKF